MLYRRYHYRGFLITVRKKTSDGVLIFTVRDSKGRVRLSWRDILTDATLSNYDIMQSYFKNELKYVIIGDEYTILS